MKGRRGITRKSVKRGENRKVRTHRAARKGRKEGRGGMKASLQTQHTLDIAPTAGLLAPGLKP